MTDAPTLFDAEALPEARRLTTYSVEWGWYDASTETMFFIHAVNGGGSELSIYSVKRDFDDGDFDDGQWLQFAYPGEPCERDAHRALTSFLELERQ